MDKLFGLFKKGKSKKEGEIKSNLNSENKIENIEEVSKLEGSKKYLNNNSEGKNENLVAINNETNSSNMNDTITHLPINNTTPDDPKAPDVVIVNSVIQTPNRAEGFYYKKYINQIEKLKLSNPILVERENMKVNFDSEVMDYLVNDMTLIFREKQALIDNNQVN